MQITRTGSAVWQGGLKDGKGSVSTQSGALNAYPYGFGSRFEGVKGSNPEELIAAAHASCFAMALSLILGNAGFVAEQLDAKAAVTIAQVGDGFEITHSQLTLRARIPGIDKAKFAELTALAKAGCPVSKVLKAAISLDATLV